MRYIWNTFFTPILVALIVLVATGFFASKLAQIAHQTEHRTIDKESVKATLGKGTLFALLGGYRSLISDFVWIKSYIEWEQKDIPACTASMELAAAIDPYMLIYWTQGAATIAYDFPHWLMRKLPESERSDEMLVKLKKKQCKIAITFLDKGLKLFPTSPELLLQKGKIAIAMEDYKLAQNCYAEVAKRPNPPIYVRRIYASLLAKNGEFKEAIVVLNSILSELEADSPLIPLITDQIKRARNLLQKQTH